MATLGRGERGDGEEAAALDVRATEVGDRGDGVGVRWRLRVGWVEADLGSGDDASQPPGEGFGEVLACLAGRCAGTAHPVGDGRLVGLEQFAVLGGDAAYVLGECVVRAPGGVDRVAQAGVGAGRCRHDRLRSGSVNRVYRLTSVTPYPLCVAGGSLIDSRPTFGPGGPQVPYALPGSGIPVPRPGRSETETR